MTVRVNKDSFNLREKLSELERPIGLKGSELMGAETAQEARDLVSAGRKNIIINGDLRIWQRSTSATINTSVNTTHRTADRWNNYHNTDGAVTESQSTDVPAGSGFYYSLKHIVTTADTSIATTQYHCHKYDIEGYDVAHLMWGTSQAKPITVSFWAKSSVTGDYGFCIRPGINNSRLYVDTLIISQANTWKKYSFTVPGCTDGTWGKVNNAGMQIQISHAMGTEYQTSTLKQWITALDVSPTTQVNWMSTVGNTWYITGLQVEVGKNATEFEHRSYAEELALCQRYFYINGGTQHQIISQAFSPHTTEIAVAWPHPTEMRAVPTVTISSTNNNNTDFYFRTINNSGFSLTGNGRSIAQMTKHHASIWFNGMSGVPQVPGQVRVQNSRTAFIHLSAEL